jgi:hypothetical protein
MTSYDSLKPSFSPSRIPVKRGVRWLHPFCARLFALLASATHIHSVVADDKFMGTGSCSSSNCHGSVNPLTGSNVLQNEYHTWLKLDKHSQAYSVLLNNDSKRIASHLRIGAPEKEPLCLKCHATYVPDLALQGEKFSIEDGVSCESCHNPSERWLQSHSVAKTSHEDNVKNGLAELVPLDARAKLCLSCHFGTDDKTVDHSLYGAGHPRLTFELDTFGVLQPKHWVVDEDYKRRKAPYVPVVTWLVGQTVQAMETLDALDSPKRSKRGLFPELSLFDCYSCHHSLTEEQWKKREYAGRPGVLHLNLPSLIVLREAVTALDATTGTSLRNALADLHEGYSIDGGRSSIKALRALIKGSVLPKVTTASGDQQYCASLLRQLSTFGAASKSLKYEVAEQVGMGMQALLATSPALASHFKPDLDKVFEALASAKSFAPETFSAACGALASRLATSQRPL